MNCSLYSFYCWWFRNPAHQLRLIVFPIIYDRFLFIPRGDRRISAINSMDPTKLTGPCLAWGFATDASSGKPPCGGFIIAIDQEIHHQCFGMYIHTYMYRYRYIYIYVDVYNIYIYTHKIHGTVFFTYIWLIFVVHVSKYTSPHGSCWTSYLEPFDDPLFWLEFGLVLGDLQNIEVKLGIQVYYQIWWNTSTATFCGMHDMYFSYHVYIYIYICFFIFLSYPWDVFFSSYQLVNNQLSEESRVWSSEAVRQMIRTRFIHVCMNC